MEGITAMISVCITTYNGEKYIEQQLRSILCQITSDDEVILSDDGSTDSTLEIVEGLRDPRIRIIHSTAHYFKGNFEFAMNHAKGDIIFLSDQDDVWLEGKVKACIEALKDVDLVCTNSKLTDANLNVINPDFFSIYNSGPGIIKNSLNNTYYGSCMAFRRRVMLAALPLPETIEIGHDIWLGLVAEMMGTVRFIPTPYLLYRRLDNSFCNTTGLAHRSKRPLWLKIWSRVVVLSHVMLFRLTHRRFRS